VFAASGPTEKFRLLANAFVADEKPVTPAPSREAYPWPTKNNIVEHIPMTPADGISPHMSYQYHVRSTGDNRVICSCTNLGDAKRIVAGWSGGAVIFQFRGADYDDYTSWRVA
jgi:hypothetical protein